MIDSGHCERSKYDPKIGSFNFTVPNERLLKIVVNLWGYEGPPSLEENLEWLRLQETFILELVYKVSIEDSDFEDICSDLKFVVQILTKCIRSLREAKVKYEQLHAWFRKKIKLQPDIESRYTVAFLDIDSFIR